MLDTFAITAQHLEFFIFNQFRVKKANILIFAH